ncbi:DUF4097 family beta strand repeat-containing protein [Paenibacillus silviterrae]|uniref:DUF4097 family beta strand repeat-containing protein n=1 Tax=Paenibacillus silviterrae TaxID=3242194 RepID=UPI002542BF9C|nr:DUF4097 family beta strand repeat-containing protein [Paenibacillus chinjuensis]
MNKLGTTLIMVLLLLMAGGLLWQKGWTGDAARVMDQSSQLNAEGVTRISISSPTIDVIWRQGSDDRIGLRLYGSIKEEQSRRFRVEKQVVQGELQIQVLDERGWFEGFYSSPDLEVTLPKTTFEQLRTVTRSGDVTAEDMITGKFQIQTHKGDVELNGLTAEALKVETDSGDVRLRRLEGKVDVHTAAGDVELLAADLKQSVNVKTASGDVTVKLITTPSALQLDLESVSGDAVQRLKGLLFTENTKYRILGGISTGGPTLRLSSTKGDITVQED